MLNPVRSYLKKAFEPNIQPPLKLRLDKLRWK